MQAIPAMACVCLGQSFGSGGLMPRRSSRRRRVRRTNHPRHTTRTDLPHPSARVNPPRDRPTNGQMERGLYIAASGMLSEMVRQDQLANDLANANTPGYKADRVSQHSFADELALVNRKTGAAVGGLGTGVQIATKATDFTPQGLKDTGEPLDLGISGDGFFAVQTGAGVRYTRDGSFAADGRGRLVDQAGNAVLGSDRRPITLNADGSVDTAKVGVFALRNPAKAGDGLVTGTVDAAGVTGSVRSGALEGAGVDASRTMVDMIASMRAFEAGQRAITTIDDTLRLATGQVGNLPG